MERADALFGQSQRARVAALPDQPDRHTFGDAQQRQALVAQQPGHQQVAVVGGGLTGLTAAPPPAALTGLRIHCDVADAGNFVCATRETGTPPRSLYWMTPQHPEQDAFHTKPFLGEAPALNETVILAYDMANPLKGGDDWTRSLIDQIRLDTDDGAGSRFRLREIAIVENPDPAVLKAPPRPEPAAPTAKAAGLR